MECRSGCGACCIAPSISQPFHGMPEGKPAGVRCVHLSELLRCDLFDSPLRPGVCVSFLPEYSVCGDDRAQALANLQHLEVLTLDQ